MLRSVVPTVAGGNWCREKGDDMQNMFPPTVVYHSNHVFPFLRSYIRLV